MEDKEIERRVEGLLFPILEERGLELVEIEFIPKGRKWLLRIFLDKEGGITISDCEWVSRELGRILDIEDFIAHSYILEVSSPGLTRALKRIEDFERYKGRKCKIITRKRIEGKNDFLGIIEGREGESILIEENKKKRVIPFAEIKRANLEYE